ncbi:peptidoglycan endopeptidase [Sphingomonas sp. RB3P16]|uniref:peptidoglycan endopeptidase n=1 Tax=Parasphingomonas frigoris TaxID=3096163 RepID=UPI002FC6C83E
MSARDAAVAAARAAVGARFRLHGRDPALGLDCVGLAALAARAGGFSGAVPGDYPLRGGDAARLAARFVGGGLVASDAPAPGDIALVAAGPAQFHLVVLVPGGFVHADAMLRRVVERPGALPWPLLGCWRVGGE